jgi:hypothetical protein
MECLFVNTGRCGNLKPLVGLQITFPFDQSDKVSKLRLSILMRDMKLTNYYRVMGMHPDFLEVSFHTKIFIRHKSFDYKDTPCLQVYDNAQQMLLWGEQGLDIIDRLLVAILVGFIQLRASLCQSARGSLTLLISWSRLRQDTAVAT